MKRILVIMSAVAALLTACQSQKTSDAVATGADVTVEQSLPITGTFLNLAYQDVRNKYTNPPYIDNTDPRMWEAKIAEMKMMGMEYLIFMAVANEEKAYYPSKLMAWHYPEWRKSPVDAIMDAAAEHGMKVFMSTGWAKDQDDNLRDPKIKGRQIEMMTELAGLYGNHPALYGWYLPVEDCLGPVLTDYAVEAVNALTARARELTPEKKILISPYGIFNSDFNDPRYEQQLSRLNVDIIAYQDEVGCVRERYPLTRLRENWKKLRTIHDKTGVQMWANCETFAWEKGTNDRSSALIPAPFPRILSQMATATAGGAERIVSFIMCGLFEDPSSQYRLGQPHWSEQAWEDYMAWISGDRYWKLAEASILGKFGSAATEDLNDALWNAYKPGTHEMILDLSEEMDVNEVLVPMLNSHKDGIVPPSKLFLFSSKDGENWSLEQIKDSPVCPNTNHDAFIDYVLFNPTDCMASYIKVAFTAESTAYFDKMILNP